MEPNFGDPFESSSSSSSSSSSPSGDEEAVNDLLEECWEEDKESDARMSNLIHQAFSASSDILPKSQTSKGLTRSCSISRYRPPRSSEVERHYNYNMNGSIKDMNRRCLINQNKSRKKSTSDLESEEVQGFKDLGFIFEKQELSPSVVNILPGLQEKNNSSSREVKLRRPYLSEAWLSNNFAPPPPPPPPPPVPNWATKNSAQDMKAQIKFWARAVASNHPLHKPKFLNKPTISLPSIFATTDDPTSLQVATSVLLTGAISVFLFRSLRRRAKRSKELKFRSSGAEKSLKDEALDSLKAMGSASIEAKAPPSPLQALLGGLTAGVIALILYKFTTTIEAALNRQTISDSFSVRQITVTVRTIINGICYLATFVFGINSIGLLLYSGQLTINSFMEDFSDNETENKGEQQSSLLNSNAESPMDSSELNSDKNDQSSDNVQ
ncbi:hypothetical protein EZV62_008112 [Acer yangbiense]|uniref:DUF3082 domain-containing protein n=1 Tax=Acer yangbiense TaxID=1000413 RepID=A0A5C7IC99_9ROSI|nr:hypothetical protein EZV62_008112 [Acer yangbiense]